MANENVIQATFDGFYKTYTKPSWLIDHGMELSISGIDLPDEFECHFSNSRSVAAKRQIGENGVVTIPDEYFLSNAAQIFCWIYLHPTVDSGVTEYEIVIPLLTRPNVDPAEPTQEQQDIVDRAIAALNAAVEQTGQDVEDANNAAESARESADAFEGMIAEEYDENKTYTIGDYSIHNDVLYRCTTAITTAEAWTAAHWTAAVLGDDVGDLKNAIDGIDEEIIQHVLIIDTADTGNYETAPSSAVRFKHLYNFEKGKKYTITMTFTGATFQNVTDAVRVNQSPNSGDGVVGLIEEVINLDAWEITGNTYTKEFTAAEGCINLIARYKFASGSQSVGFVVTESKGLKTVVNELDASIDTRFEYARQTSRMEMGAHRGAEFYAPPNCVAAYEIAGKMGFPWAWLAQIRWSAEKTLYVMHDEDVSVTTNGTGNMSELTDEYIDSLLCNKIQAYDYSKFSNDDLRVPTLEKAIQICLRYGMKMCFRIEPFPATMETEDEIAIWTNFQTVVKAYGISADWAVYSGYNPNEMKLCRTLLGDNVELCPYLGVNISAQDYIDWFTENGISGNRSVLMPVSAVTLTEAKLLHSNGIKLYAFTNSTVPTQATVEQLATWGVDILQNPKFARITDTY